MVSPFTIPAAWFKSGLVTLAGLTNQSPSQQAVYSEVGKETFPLSSGFTRLRKYEPRATYSLSPSMDRKSVSSRREQDQNRGQMCKWGVMRRDGEKMILLLFKTLDLPFSPLTWTNKLLKLIWVSSTCDQKRHNCCSYTLVPIYSIWLSLYLIQSLWSPCSLALFSFLLYSLSFFPTSLVPPSWSPSALCPLGFHTLPFFLWDSIKTHGFKNHSYSIYCISDIPQGPHTQRECRMPIVFDTKPVPSPTIFCISTS